MSEAVREAVELMREVAQNDYMIGHCYLSDGVEMMELAEELERMDKEGEK